ncbi:tetratricopeptide repeat protein [Nitrosophilus alvini]|uniref:tetratricopeptide repeat protein n=1 Tax=Nitrosophilus alvini TaxID=2714855 RepID=UPI00190B3E04|nr:hypothetical protein [Nitrosophilus alvini]
MSWHKKFFLILPFLFFFNLQAQNLSDINRSDNNATSVKETNTTKKKEQEKFVFKQAMRDYRLGSYYEAVDEFSKILSNPASPYYKKSLLMLGKVYLQIGKRTGIKKYLWTADAFLNLYAGKTKKLDWDYYYTKGNVYETLEFYDKAYANYKIALFKTDSNEEQIKTIIAIMRVGVWLKRKDIVTKYAVVLNMSKLKKEHRKELDFLKGMQFFTKKDYKKAFEFFLKTYREFESYLLDNPQYYLLIAETAYRMGDYSFAEKLFRRIFNLIKNREVLKKALLRMGDIGLKKGDVKSALNYYYQLVSKYPKSQEATVAKLKLLSIIKEKPEIESKLKELLPEADFLKNPDGFIVKTLVLNRTNYIGRFAIANFGVISFELESEKLYERLTWELSLLSSDRLDYEQIEYIRDLWTPYLLNIEPKIACRLYNANPLFFKVVFDQKVLIKISGFLKECTENRRRLEFLEYILNRWTTDANRFLLAKALYEIGDFQKCIDVLKKIKRKNCEYYKLYSKSCIIGNLDCANIPEKCEIVCSEADFEAKVVSNYAKLVREEPEAIEFIIKNIDKISSIYKRDEIVKKLIQKCSEFLIERREYRKIITILEPIKAKIGKNCYIDALLVLSYVRIGKMNYAKEAAKELDGCEDNWAVIAKSIYEAETLKTEASNE